MGYIHYALNILISIFIIIVITKIYMMVANYVGEQLRLGKFFIYLWRKIRMKK
ncbi:hypothetical protein [Clostridium estertheticum]|uniref:hypothetical protein n=1 Tax=Clostridium estertheticum TaxID=238834 RepID=UPI001C7D846B|nr:hypothetical protein [Clostridium estertheticum]MBX4271955.1 hypothetical protein [Clostridium estertheticum]MCB2356179.1 hypothetical protein [Clostridium estertheticum]MCB2360888.1 hypothetical protein [Clostridium estertheticum]WAG43673.1 hypothetical protein LL065_25050 [Clostridium estertheticum]WLC82072.1 hypothetical protein KTC98_22990 [Clostridium estertheticum]